MVIRFAEQYNVVVCWLEILEGVSFASAAYATVPKHYYLQHELVKSAIEFALLMHSLVWFIHGHWIPVSVRHTLFAEGVGILVMLFLALISASRASFIGIAIMHFCWIWKPAIETLARARVIAIFVCANVLCYGIMLQLRAAFVMKVCNGTLCSLCVTKPLQLQQMHQISVCMEADFEKKLKLEQLTSAQASAEAALADLENRRLTEMAEHRRSKNEGQESNIAMLMHHCVCAPCSLLCCQPLCQAGECMYRNCACVLTSLLPPRLCWKQSHQWAKLAVHFASLMVFVQRSSITLKS